MLVSVRCAPDLRRHFADGFAVAVNLLDWAREHAADDFGVEPTDENAARIAAGFRQLKRSMAGKLRRKNGAPYTVSTYKGWTLAAVEEKKESADD